MDAGRVLTAEDYSEHTPAFDLKYRNMAPELIRSTRHRQKDCYACMEWNYDWFRNDLEEPYTTPKDKPFSWQLGRHSIGLGDLPHFGDERGTPRCGGIRVGGFELAEIHERRDLGVEHKLAVRLGVVVADENGRDPAGPRPCSIPNRYRWLPNNH